jgi:hypothetical protein
MFTGSGIHRERICVACRCRLCMLIPEQYICQIIECDEIKYWSKAVDPFINIGNIKAESVVVHMIW